MTKILNEGVHKAIKKALQSETSRYNSQQVAFQNENLIQENLKKKKMLETLSQAIFDKNYNLYLSHEKMLDEEKSKRSDLGKRFQDEMNEITQQINEKKEKRQAEYDENTAVRKKI